MIRVILKTAKTAALAAVALKAAQVAHKACDRAIDRLGGSK